MSQQITMLNRIPSRVREKLFLLALVASILLLDPICAAQTLSNENDDFDTIALKSRSRSRSSSGGSGGSPLVVGLILIGVLGAVIVYMVVKKCGNCSPKDDEERQGSQVSNHGSTESFKSDKSFNAHDDDFRRANDD